MKEHRLKQQQHLRRKLQKAQTYPGIISTIISLLNTDITTTIITLPTPSSPSDSLIQQALDEQLLIEENQLEKGFCSKTWIKAQRSWEASCGIHSNNQWGTLLCTTLQQYTYSIWKQRNEFIHGKQQKESNKLKRKRIVNTVKELYQRPRILLSLDAKKLFKLPIQQRLK